jgi:hypothetical protein
VPAKQQILAKQVQETKNIASWMDYNPMLHWLFYHFWLFGHYYAPEDQQLLDGAVVGHGRSFTVEATRPCCPMQCQTHCHKQHAHGLLQEYVPPQALLGWVSALPVCRAALKTAGSAGWQWCAPSTCLACYVVWCIYLHGFVLPAGHTLPHSGISPFFVLPVLSSTVLCPFHASTT